MLPFEREWLEREGMAAIELKQDARSEKLDLRLSKRAKHALQSAAAATIAST